VIDYKWDTYTRDFFLLKFVIYGVFIVFYYIDLQAVSSMHDTPRNKDWIFYTCKTIEIVIQLLFLAYEGIQMKIEKDDYYQDIWNYMELLGIVFFAWAAGMDIVQDTVSTTMKVVFSLSIMFSLIKIVYLIRVFRQLNFLVTMFNTVVNEIFYFMILFLIFILTFAESFHIVGVDIESYGRTP